MSPSIGPAPRIGASSRLPGRWPTHISSIGSSSTAGTTRQAASSKVSMPPAVSDGSYPFSSTVGRHSRRPTRHGHGETRAGRWRVGRWGTNRAAKEGGSGVHVYGEHLPLDRPHRGQQSLPQAGNAARPGTGRKHDHIGRYLGPVGDNDAIDAPATG